MHFKFDASFFKPFHEIRNDIIVIDLFVIIKSFCEQFGNAIDVGIKVLTFDSFWDLLNSLKLSICKKDLLFGQ